jgi:hypothetical protein
MIPSAILELEDAYDQKSPKDFALWLHSQPHWAWMRSLLLAHRSHQWPESEIIAREIWTQKLEAESFQGKSPSELACFLELAVSASSLRYSMTDRVRWMSCWQKVQGWPNEPYAQWVRSFEEGLTHFFSGSLREASACFEMTLSLAERENYDRGKIRSLMHLGLVARDRGATGEATLHFEKALALAILQGRTSLVARIQAFIQELQVTDALESLLVDQQFKEARERLIREEAKRRARGLLRKRQSLYIYPSSRFGAAKARGLPLKSPGSKTQFLK